MIDLRQNFVFVLSFEIKSGGSGLLQSNLGITDDVRNQLLFNTFLTEFGDQENLVSFHDLLLELGVDSLHGAVVLENDLASAFLRQIHSSLDTNALCPLEHC